MMKQTATETLLKLKEETPSLRLCVEVDASASEFPFPPGNLVAMGLFADALRMALEMDGVELLGIFYSGEFNHGSYSLFVEPGKIGVAALVLKSLIENHLHFAWHLLEIVAIDGESSTVVSQVGAGWGTVAQRHAWTLAWAEHGAQSMEAAAIKSAQLNVGIDAQIAELTRRIDELMSDRDAGEDWKRGDQEGDTK